MPKRNKIFQKIAFFCLALLVVFIAWSGLAPAPASSQQVDSRVYGLEADVRGIESRLDRIETQLSQQSRFQSPGPSAAPPQYPINSGRNRQRLSRDQMFDRLATLVIELKQQINQLEARVSKLESRGAPRTNR